MPDSSLTLQALAGAATAFSAVVAFFAYQLRRGQKKAADLQVTSTSLVAFQNAWQERNAILMRQWIHSKTFRVWFIATLNRASGNRLTSTQVIDDSLIDVLLSTPYRDEALDDFVLNLQDENHAIFYDPAHRSGTQGMPLFTAFDALERTLQIFDRLALVRNEPLAIKIIKAYKPPIRDLSRILQAYIAVRTALSKEEDRNYKKDYMLLLHKLGLEHKALFERCKEGLKDKGELAERELRLEEKIKSRKYSGSGFLTKTFACSKRNAGWNLSLVTAIILILTLIVQCTNFNSLNRPFVEIAPISFRCDPQEADPEKEGAKNRFCNVLLRIENYGPIPAFDVQFQGLKMGSKSRGYFSEKDPWYKEIKDFKRGWLWPRSRKVIGTGMRFVIADTTIRKYNDGEEAFEIDAKLIYSGPPLLWKWWRPRYWYSITARYKFSRWNYDAFGE